MVNLMVLPFAKNSLEPHISEKTLEFHYGKHHQTYYNNLVGLIKDTELADKTLEEIIRTTAGRFDQVAIFNNAAQVFNHNFYWQSLRPVSEEIPSDIKELLIKDFGSLEKFQEDFKAAAISQFGSGWAWLVLEGGVVKVVKTANADNPLVHNQKPLLVIDVWEHAYYLDYQNRRADYVEAIIKNLLNWEFFKKNLAS